VTVPFLDLQRLHASIADELRVAVDDVVSRSAFVGGAGVEAFEVAFGEAHDLGRGAGCGSGTDALALALRALGVGPGDEVIVPAMTFVATAEAVVHVGATPVVADVDPQTLLLGPEQVAAVRSSATRGVIPVHLYGHVVPPEHLRAWRDDGLVVVEDAAQAHLAHHDGTGIGSIGHAVCFSFYPGKNLGAFGDGGMVLSSDDALTGEVRRIRDHGRSTKYLHDVVGWCSRLDGLQAAVLNVKLGHLAAWTDARRARAADYRDRIGDLLVPWEDGAVHHLLVARFADRTHVQAELSAAGIGNGVHYPVPLSAQPWLEAAGAQPCPNAEKAGADVLSLPMDPLMTTADVDEVCRAIESLA
jgi:dTDP-4-amino-4,6-dideoxygalactose transaminase